MKRLLVMITMLLTIAVSASALSYSRARTQALFLTDKMAYELNLTDDQYNACYEINLDYYLSISVEGDLFGVYWTRRNQDLSYVLSPSQYAFYTAATYFYRPVTWVSRAFHYVIYDRYNRNRFYRKAPSVYDTYRGGNRMYSVSPYKGRTFGGSKAEPRKNVVPPKQQPLQAQKSWRNNSNFPQKSRSQAVKEGHQQAQQDMRQMPQKQVSNAGGNNSQRQMNNGGDKKQSQGISIGRTNKPSGNTKQGGRR